MAAASLYRQPKQVNKTLKKMEQELTAEQKWPFSIKKLDGSITTNQQEKLKSMKLYDDNVKQLDIPSYSNIGVLDIIPAEVDDVISNLKYSTVLPMISMESLEIFSDHKITKHINYLLAINNYLFIDTKEIPHYHKTMPKSWSYTTYLKEIKSLR